MEYFKMRMNAALCCTVELSISFIFHVQILFQVVNRISRFHPATKSPEKRAPGTGHLVSNGKKRMPGKNCKITARISAFFSCELPGRMSMPHMNVCFSPPQSVV